MAEILHQLIGSLSHYLQGFIHPRWLAGFLPSTVLVGVVVMFLWIAQERKQSMSKGSFSWIMCFTATTVQGKF